MDGVQANQQPLSWTMDPCFLDEDLVDADDRGTPGLPIGDDVEERTEKAFRPFQLTCKNPKQEEEKGDWTKFAERVSNPAAGKDEPETSSKEDPEADSANGDFELSFDDIFNDSLEDLSLGPQKKTPRQRAKPSNKKPKEALRATSPAILIRQERENFGKAGPVHDGNWKGRSHLRAGKLGWRSTKHR